MKQTQQLMVYIRETMSGQGASDSWSVEMFLCEDAAQRPVLMAHLGIYMKVGTGLERMPGQRWLQAPQMASTHRIGNRTATRRTDRLCRLCTEKCKWAATDAIWLRGRWLGREVEMVCRMAAAIRPTGDARQEMIQDGKLPDVRLMC